MYIVHLLITITIQVVNLIDVGPQPSQVAEDKDSMNGVQQLSLEATAINQNFSQQVREVGSQTQGAYSIKWSFIYNVMELYK